MKNSRVIHCANARYEGRKGRTFTVIGDTVEKGTCGEPGCVAEHSAGSQIHIDINGNGWYRREELQSLEGDRHLQAR